MKILRNPSTYRHTLYILTCPNKVTTSYLNNKNNWAARPICHAKLTRKTMSNFPHDVLLEVLSMLPVKSLLRVYASNGSLWSPIPDLLYCNMNLPSKTVLPKSFYQSVLFILRTLLFSLPFCENGRNCLLRNSDLAPWL